MEGSIPIYLVQYAKLEKEYVFDAFPIELRFGVSTDGKTTVHHQKNLF